MMIGRYPVKAEPKVEQKDELRNMIGPNQVRAALLELIQNTPDYPVFKNQYYVVMNSPVTSLDDSTFCIGNWYCDHKNLTFVISFDTLPFFLEYKGRFEQDSHGKWKAVITRRRNTHNSGVPSPK
jgi:hypothetical protein